MQNNPFLWPPGFTDFHIHILPGIDDGAQDIEESLEMAEMLCKIGIYAAVATPHFIYEHNITGFLENVKSKYMQLKSELKERDIPLTLYLGYEVYATQDLLHADYIKKLTIENTSRIVVELPSSASTTFLDDLLYAFDIWGLKLILAHPERCKFFAKNFDYLKRLSLQGVLMQCNIGSFEGLYGKQIKKIAEEMLSLSLVQLIGTDAHSLNMLRAISQNLKYLNNTYFNKRIDSNIKICS